MLNKLTAAQKARLTEVRDRWVKIGLSTKRADRKLAEYSLAEVYRAGGLPAPRLIVWLESPLAGVLGTALLRFLLKSQVRSQVGSQVWSLLYDNTCYGAHDAAWLGFYDYFGRVCGLTSVDKLHGLIQMAESCGWFWPHADVVVLTERHTTLHQDAQGRLHYDGGMACAYPDGWGLHSWHGVRMEPWMIETPAEQLDIQKVLEVKNVEQRTACIQKLGVERLIQKIGAKTIDLWKDYTLLEIQLNDRPCRYLKMKNPSVGIWHVEGVPNECMTVSDALHSRKPAALQAIPIDDEHGEDWMAQGDVNVWPKDAQSVKRYPVVQT